MKVNVIRPTCCVMPANKMNCGSMGRIVNQISGCRNHIVVMSYVGLIDLNDPNKTWDNKTNLEIDVFPSGSVVQLEVE